MSTEILELQEDQKARWVAQSEFSKHIVVEAGAGTGKTATLIARIVFWSLTDGWQKYAASYDAYDDIALGVAEGVASITFTENAVKEMAERLGLAYQAFSGESGRNCPAFIGIVGRVFTVSNSDDSFLLQ